MSAPRRIGVLGGMGPEATVLLMRRLIAATPAEDDADHVPLLVDMNPQVPSRIEALIEGRSTDPGPVLAAMARRLEAGGAEALAMPCNTAHHYAPAIRGAVAIPLLDMVALSAAQAAARAEPGGRVGVLGSPAIRTIGLFDAALASRGAQAVYPEDQEALLAAVRAVKRHGPTPEATAALHQASRALAAAGAGVQIVACTEFSILERPEEEGAEILDALDVLVAAILAFSMGDAGAPGLEGRTGALQEEAALEQ